MVILTKKLKTILVQGDENKQKFSPEIAAYRLTKAAYRSIALKLTLNKRGLVL